ncbi:MAG: methylmalonyl Co-A mutase-associated GTPase MeaB [bacterium JZ-2024 1]
MVRREKLQDYVEGIRKGDIRWISKSISLVENLDEDSWLLLSEIYPLRKEAQKVGCTGSPGVGKSSLIAQLIPYFHHNGHKIGIIAIDPTSPISGGALLGDRVRMQEQLSRYGVYMRSLATRGGWGGVPLCLPAVIHILEAAGYSLIFLESIGVGQDQIDLAHNSDTLLLLLIPESGDVIQGMKAGLNELADIFVVHKSDRQGAETLQRALQEAIRLAPANSGWLPPVLLASSLKKEGLEEIVQQVLHHQAFLKSSGLGKLRKKQQIHWEIYALVHHSLRMRTMEILQQHLSESIMEDLLSARLSPYAFLLQWQKSLNVSG